MYSALLTSFPRHRAAASLKRRFLFRSRIRRSRFPRHRAAASLKPRGGTPCWSSYLSVFRGIGPRPH